MKNYFRWRPSNRYFFLAIFIGGMVGVATSYQNCGSSNSSGSAFNLISGTSGTILGVTTINLGQATYSAGVSMTGSATVINGTDPINCQWVIMFGQSLINTFNSVSSESICSLPSGASAPAAAGAYTLTLTVTKGSSQGSTSTGFSVQGNSTATPTPTATPNPTPPPTPGYYCTCNSGPQPICSGNMDMTGKTCYLGGDTWNCTFCANHCGANPEICN